jgi:transcriptional regulator
MYVPKHFREDRVTVLHEAIRAFPFATLVTHADGEFLASHVPVLIDPEPLPFGSIICHVAKANPQWRVPPGTQALAIFMGPHAYISPGWYATKRITGKVVPTWDYIAVHARGPMRAFRDPERLRAVVTRLTETHEAGSLAPWAVTDAPAGYVDAQLRAIVGIEIPIVRLEGKWKLSQNRPEADRVGVVDGLRATLRAGDAATADAVEATFGSDRAAVE